MPPPEPCGVFFRGSRRLHPPFFSRFRDLGYRTKHSNDDIAHTSAIIAFDRDDREICGGLNIQTYFEWASAEDPVEVWPEDYVMASRNALLLRGMGIVLGIQLSIAKARGERGGMPWRV